MNARLIAIIGAALLAVTAALVVYTREGNEPLAPIAEERSAVVKPSQQRFKDISQYMEASGRAGRPGPVVFIGIDGGGWRFIDPLIDAGELPNIERMKREGAFATLRSTACYVSPPAWVTMFTGCGPAKTGVYTFGRPAPGDYDFVPVTSEDVAVPSVWDVASFAGRRVAVVNVPVTYPVRPVNGIMISGIMTPNDAAEPLVFDIARHDYLDRVPVDPAIVSYAPVARAAFGDSLNTLLLAAYDSMDDGRSNYDRVQVSVLSMPLADEAGQELGSHSMQVGSYSPWMRVRARRGGDIVDAWCKLEITGIEDGQWAFNVSPTLFAIDAPYVFPPEFRGVLEKAFGYYMPSKLLDKDMVPAITDEAVSHAVFLYDFDDWDLYEYVFTQSDNVHHVGGFGGTAVSVYKKIDAAIGEIMKRLPDDGTLIVASDHGFDEYTHSIDLNQYLATLGLLQWRSPGVVDYEKTLVYHNLWHLYFNRNLMTEDELEHRAIHVSAGEDVESALVRALTDAGKQLRWGGASFPLEFTPLAKGVGDTPDMRVRGTYDGYTVDFWNLKIPRPHAVRESVDDDKWDHTREGVFLAWGGAVREGYDAGVKDIADVAPTILYLMNLPVSDEIDGAVMYDALRPAFTSQQSLVAVADYKPISTEPLEHEENREALEKKLRSLGYIR